MSGGDGRRRYQGNQAVRFQCVVIGFLSNRNSGGEEFFTDTATAKRVPGGVL
jgi:hypothetical protein